METTRPEIVTIPNVVYSKQFQNKLATEIEENNLVPCSPIDFAEPCSAWKRAVIDYGDQRKKTRIANGEELDGQQNQ